MKRLLLVLLAWLLASCATTDDPNSPYYIVPTGSRLTLLTELEFPPNEGTLHIQFGRILPPSRINELEGYCYLDLRTVVDQWQTVKPGEFEIYRVNRGSGSLWVSAPLVVAGMGSGEGPTQWYYKTYFWLRSPMQPQVSKLTCLADRLTAGGLVGSWLTVPQIQETLDGIFTLTLADEATSVIWSPAETQGKPEPMRLGSASVLGQVGEPRYLR